MHCMRGEAEKNYSIAFSANSLLHLSLDGKRTEEIHPDHIEWRQRLQSLQGQTTHKLTT